MNNNIIRNKKRVIIKKLYIFLLGGTIHMELSFRSFLFRTFMRILVYDTIKINYMTQCWFGSWNRGILNTEIEARVLKRIRTIDYSCTDTLNIYLKQIHSSFGPLISSICVFI